MSLLTILNHNVLRLSKQMEISKLSLKESWFTSKECRKLTEYAKDLIKKDDLNPCDIEVINNDIPDEHQEEFWEKIMEYFDML